MFSQLETSSNLLWSKIGHSFQISGWNHLPDGTWREGQYLFQLAAWQIVSNSRLWLSQLPSQGGEVGCLLSWVGRWQQQYVTMPHHNTHQSQPAVRVWECESIQYWNLSPLFLILLHYLVGCQLYIPLTTRSLNDTEKVTATHCLTTMLIRSEQHEILLIILRLSKALKTNWDV